MVTRLPPPVFEVILWPGLALSAMLSWPSTGELADKVQSAAPPGDTVSDKGTEPRLTSALARLLPRGKLNTPVGKVTAMVAEASPTWLVGTAWSCSSLILMGKLATVPPDEPVNPELGKLKYTVAALTVRL
jgi:hypothetical protein